jgi:hypothetical protein
VNFLRPGHETTTDKRALERAVVAEHLRLIITVAQVRVHSEGAKTSAAPLVNALTFFSGVQQATLVLKYIILPSLMGIHILRKRSNIILIFEHADAEILQSQSLAHEQPWVIV